MSHIARLFPACLLGSVVMFGCGGSNDRVQTESAEAAPNRCPPNGADVAISVAMNPNTAARYSRCPIKLTASFAASQSAATRNTYFNVSHQDIRLFDVRDPSSPGAVYSVAIPSSEGRTITSLKPGTVLTLLGTTAHYADLPSPGIVFRASSVTPQSTAEPARDPSADSEPKKQEPEPPPAVPNPAGLLTQEETDRFKLYENKNTVAGYLEFLGKYPQSPYAAKARYYQPFQGQPISSTRVSP